MRKPRFLLGAVMGIATFTFALGVSLALPAFPLLAKNEEYREKGRSERVSSVRVNTGVQISTDLDLVGRNGRYNLLSDNNEVFASFDHVEIYFLKWSPDAVGKWDHRPSEPEAHVNGATIKFDIFFAEGEEIAFQTQTVLGETFVFSGELRKGGKPCQPELEGRPGFDGRLVKLRDGKLIATMQASFYLGCGC